MVPFSWQEAIRASGGYAWWYVDAAAPSGDALVCILLVGSVFSPRYAARLRRGEAPMPMPTEHCAVNLALYRGGRQIAWVMSEYDAPGALDDERIEIGRSSLVRDEGGWTIRIEDHRAPFMHPWGRALSGTIRVRPLADSFGQAQIAMPRRGGMHAPNADGAGDRAGGDLHAWRALAPRAHVEAEISSGKLDFRLDAVGYHDRNHGDGRLEDAFSRWGWARFHGPERTTILYSFVGRDGDRHAFLVDGDDRSGATPAPVPPLGDGPPLALRWGMVMPSSFAVAPPGFPIAATSPGSADVRGSPEFPDSADSLHPSDAQANAQAVQSEAADGGLRAATTTLLERTPFYTRYRCRLDGGPPDTAEGLGEYLDLDRFRSRWNQFLLRFKTHRRR